MYSDAMMLLTGSVLFVGAVLALTHALQWAWVRFGPVDDATLYEAGQLYVDEFIEENGDSWNTRAKLWQEYEEGMTFDPSAFERGMRERLDSLAPLEPAPAQ